MPVFSGEFSSLSIARVLVTFVIAQKESWGYPGLPWRLLPWRHWARIKKRRKRQWCVSLWSCKINICSPTVCGCFSPQLCYVCSSVGRLSSVTRKVSNCLWGLVHFSPSGDLVLLSSAWFPLIQDVPLSVLWITERSDIERTAEQKLSDSILILLCSAFVLWPCHFYGCG